MDNANSEKIEAILDFINCKTSELERDIVNMVRNNINNTNDFYKCALKEKIAQLEYIEKYLDKAYIYEFISDYYEE